MNFFVNALPNAIISGLIGGLVIAVLMGIALYLDKPKRRFLRLIREQAERRKTLSADIERKQARITSLENRLNKANNDNVVGLILVLSLGLRATRTTSRRTYAPGENKQVDRLRGSMRILNYELASTSASLHVLLSAYRKMLTESSISKDTDIERITAELENAHAQEM